MPDQSGRATDDDSNEAKIERVCAILDVVSQRFAPDSKDALAIRDAAMAYRTVRQNQDLKRAYDHLCSRFEGCLTDEMMAKLQRQGIDPDELELDDIGDWNLEK